MVWSSVQDKRRGSNKSIFYQALKVTEGSDPDQLEKTILINFQKIKKLRLKRLGQVFRMDDGDPARKAWKSSASWNDWETEGLPMSQALLQLE